MDLAPELESDGDADADDGPADDGGPAGDANSNDGPADASGGGGEGGGLMADEVKLEVWEDRANWISTGKGDIDQHVKVKCYPHGGFVAMTKEQQRKAANNASPSGHTAAMIVLDPPYLPGDRFDLTEIADMLQACGWWANVGCVLIIFIDWQWATPWIQALKKLKWSVEGSQLVIARKDSK